MFNDNSITRLMLSNYVRILKKLVAIQHNYNGRFLTDTTLFIKLVKDHNGSLYLSLKPKSKTLV